MPTRLSDITGNAALNALNFNIVLILKRNTYYCTLLRSL
jgi:hypothetical protein